MSIDITEFVEIDPSNVDAVFKAANGTDFLMIKQVADEDEKKEPDGDDDDAEKAEFCGDATCEVCLDRAAKGKLSMAQRRKIPKGSFAIPEKAPESGSYPINDKAHARNALSRVAQHGTPEEKARVRRAVAAKYPSIGKSKKKGKKEMGSQESVEQSFHGQTPSAEAQMGQTRSNQRSQTTNKDVVSDRPSGQPKSLEAGSINAEGEGFGDTAPDKDIHKDEASSQRESARKETIDMKGDTMPASPDEGPEADGVAQSQTKANTRTQVMSGVADQMRRQAAQSQKSFKFKVKKGGKKKRKKNAPLEISGAMKQQGPERVLSEALASKEFDDMNGAELAEVFTAALDARDARKAEERKAKKAARKEKEAKKQAKAEKKAKKAAQGTGQEKIEEDADASKSMAPELLVSGVAEKVSLAVKDSLMPLMQRIQNLENQPARPRLAVNNLAGTTPVMRDQQNPGGDSRDPIVATKALAERFEAETDPQKKERLGNELTKARLVIAERNRHGTAAAQ